MNESRPVVEWHDGHLAGRDPIGPLVARRRAQMFDPLVVIQLDAGKRIEVV